MPLARPTPAELIDRVRGDLRGRLEIEGPLLRRAMVDVLGAVWGGTVHTLYGFLDWAVKQLFGYSAEREYLLHKAAMYGITPVPATFATGNVIATGADGSTVDTDTILRLDATRAYRVTAGDTIDVSGQVVVPVIALLAGDNANLPENAMLSFESPIDFVNPTATVSTGGITGGVEEEGTEEVRDRFLLRLREPPEGGADQDWVGWALEVAGVTRAWVYEHEFGLGTLVVRFVMDGEADLIPDAGAVAAVQAKFAAERPMCTAPTAAAPIALAVPFTISIVPDNAGTQAAVAAELADLLRRVAEPGDGIGRGTVLISQIRTAIGIAAGVTDYTLTVPSANVVPGVGELPKVGAITWA